MFKRGDIVECYRESTDSGEYIGLIGHIVIEDTVRPLVEYKEARIKRWWTDVMALRLYNPSKLRLIQKKFLEE